MKNLIKARTTSSESVLINEDQVCTIDPGEKIVPGNKKVAIVKMSNGDERLLLWPDWDMWENDLYNPS